jgi:CheY-like chemotaxis protein
MHKVRLIHWKPVEAEVEISKLRAGGYEVDFEVFDGPPAMRRMKEEPPTAVIIDLTRLPSQGRDVALAVRHAKTTRHIPIVFVGGDPDKVERIQKLIPDAVYTEWNQIAQALDHAISHPLESPVVPKSLLNGYADAPLLKKLGVKADTTLALIDAPPGFPKKLGKLPDGVTIKNHTQDQSDLIIWFTKFRDDLDQNLDGIAAALAPKGGLWIAWPKKTSGEASDLSQTVVRKIGLAAGLVDYKVCAIDETWSGLKFAPRRVE